MAASPPLIPVILAGGSGARLWPVSQKDNPKQFMKIGGTESLLVQTIRRAVKCAESLPPAIIIVTLESLRERTQQEIDAAALHIPCIILGEPESKNTAPAIAYAAHYISAHFGADSLMWVLPADHHIGQEDVLEYALKQARSLAQELHIVTFGITPQSADTAYGYIQTGTPLSGNNTAHRIARFTEKPDAALAQRYLSAGGYLWNSGMFVMQLSVAAESYQHHAPEIFEAIGKYGAQQTLPPTAYHTLSSIPFDVAIMEKIDNGAVIACDMAWSDVGTWNSIWQMRDKNIEGNALSGRVTCIESKDCLIESSALLIAAIGLEDVAIVESGDSVLVADKKNPRAMQALAQALENTPAKTSREMRPWGHIRTLTHSPGYVIKEITLHPGHKQSLQSHAHRCEFLTIVSGQADVRLHGSMRPLKAKDHLFIPLGAAHRIENNGACDLVAIEVQIGDPVSHEDITRFDDMYGRANEQGTRPQEYSHGS